MIKYVKMMACFAIFSLYMISPGLSGITQPVWADESETEFNIKNEGVKKDNIFNLFFGGAPLMPTENGTVIIDAFLDDNNNQKWDDGEIPLEKAVVCVLDNVEYPLPAFIPGLENGTNYPLSCSSAEYDLSVKQKSVFIKKRGEIIKIDIPCQPTEQRTAMSSNARN
ncbi:hypothetical protein Pcar_1627 [Syntrophotalea carbinolica DSM 2380]|uniref:Uncharacterized protein n=1 Tax=Syntrophotalea carbinolica (strain DSM 2380 / NBRC 103641 / GraBd1) TaxID=338963 RepID=Q3A436_SYNC1|nr:hypothetical protein [Syntrophotalea carbinolica]ABA88871.1 hypothetical protein Pcar_1627 [Syntrophotalea carbinolica DSM 2380]